LKAWLIRVTINLSKSRLRFSWLKKTVPLSEHAVSGADDRAYSGMPDAVDMIGSTETTDVYDAVMSLSEKYRSVVMLYYFEDYSIREISQILNKTETAIQTRLQRARAMLKDKLKEGWGND